MQNQKFITITLPQKLVWSYFYIKLKTYHIKKFSCFRIFIFGLLYRKYFARKTVSYSKNNTIYRLASYHKNKVCIF